ncbi:helix-turn-helix transcriptional regulator [Pseudomonas citronellolis]|uniref:helix-turn-helix transcriptional regulator n=1 Tax=Pseudomonas citronellolis TaxID=53408 RepID=UPI0023E3D662|nr:AraC family transcriptional regulator [Pseudomonas citronellolis]MDF3933304.1 AraC family transcriptional regulator [Pseudomonas citronellolis]
MSQILSLRRYSHEHLAHSHDHAQLVLGLSGSLEFEVGGLGSQVGRQRLAVVPRDTHHACAAPGGSQCLVFDLEDEDLLLRGLGEHAQSIRRLLERPAALTLNPAQGQLVHWLAASPLQDPVIARQGALLLLASLAGMHAAEEPARLPLASLDSYIDRHAGHPLQVADLARLAGLSAARFHARFLAETGQTPMDYVRQRRLQLGRELLASTHLAVGEIAARVGYASQSAFTAALVRQFGSTPRQLRRETRDNSR